MLMIIKYGPENLAEQGKLEMALAGDEVVLLQNGVFWAVTDQVGQVEQQGAKVYALEGDLLARGYSAADVRVPLVNYDGLLDIIERQERSLG